MFLKSLNTLLLSTTLLFSGTITLTGACACNSIMSKTFTEIDTHIVDDNLKEIDKALEAYIKPQEKKIEKLKKEKAILVKLINKNRYNLAYLQKIAFVSNLEIKTRSKHNIINMTSLILEKTNYTKLQNLYLKKDNK